MITSSAGIVNIFFILFHISFDNHTFMFQHPLHIHPTALFESHCNKQFPVAAKYHTVGFITFLVLF